MALNINSLLYADEGIGWAGDGGDVKIKWASVASAACEIDRLHLVKSDVDRRFVDKDETSF